MRIKIILIFIIFSFTAVKAETLNINKNEIFKNLRCLICQGQSVADSNSEFAQTIKSVVEDQINDGRSEEEIYKFLIDKYGEWIFYRPLLNKHNFLLWALPYLILLFGGLLIFFIIRKGKNKWS
jgi:cytochrome c-type biogenesis protein CcmH